MFALAATFPSHKACNSHRFGGQWQHLYLRDEHRHYYGIVQRRLASLHFRVRHCNAGWVSFEHHSCGSPQTASNGVLDQLGGHDERAFLSSKALGSGVGIVVIDSGTQSTVSVDAALIPTYLTATASLAFPSIATGAGSSELTISLTGANSGDSVAPGWPPSMPQGVLGMMRVSSTGVVAVRICNFSGTAVTPQADTFRATVVRSL